MCHGPGSLKRMNPNATSENEIEDKEKLDTQTEGKTDAFEIETIVKDNLEIRAETHKKKA